MKKLRVAIDGPAGAGKSTVAQIVAERLGYIYIDTGAMYRALTWQVIQKSLDVNDENAVAAIARETKIGLSFAGGKTRVFVDETEVTDLIRQKEVTNLVSGVAKWPAVRKVLLKAQQEMARSGGVVMDGRDVGTFILPDAEVKIFLTASISERAKRRYLEFKEKNPAARIDLAEIEREIAARDEADTKRETAPLCQAPDAIVLDTTELSIEETAQKILGFCGNIF